MKNFYEDFYKKEEQESEPVERQIPHQSFRRVGPSQRPSHKVMADAEIKRRNEFNVGRPKHEQLTTNPKKIRRWLREQERQIEQRMPHE